MTTQILFKYSIFHLVKETNCYLMLKNVYTDELVRLNKKKDQYSIQYLTAAEIEQQNKIRQMSKLEWLKYNLALEVD